VERLKCKKKFNASFITGISGASIKKDNVLKHTKSDMHLTAVNIEKKTKDN
jgi:hypothetical protein